MIELLGVGVRHARDAWLFREVCVRFERGTLGAIVAESAAPAAALLDAVTGRSIPHEGRVWITRLPVMRETRGRVRRLVGDVTTASVLATHRSVLWNTMTTPRSLLAGLLPFPRSRAQQAALSALAVVGLEQRADDPARVLSASERVRVSIARTLARGPAALVLRDVDAVLGPHDASSILAVMRRLARSQRLSALVSLTSLPLALRHADQVLVLPAGELVRDRRTSDVESEHVCTLETAAR